MGHPADGMIRAFLDGEATGNVRGIQAHVADCPRCGELAQAQARALDSFSDALSLLDIAPRSEAARVRILQKHRETRRGKAIIRRNLPRAASFAILFTAGAAAALPGSPVRRWVAEGWDRLSEREDSTVPVPSPSQAGDRAEGPGARPATVGASTAVGLGGIELQVRDLSESASLRILLVEGSEAAIFAGEGTQFRTEEGRLVASGPPGDVTMEIPAGALRVTVIVNGETYLRKTEGGMEVLRPVRARTPTEIHFGPAGPGTNAPPSGG